MPALNYTTAIPADRTIGEMQTMLGKAGAAAVAITYQGGEPAGMRFTLATPSGLRAFALPVDIEAMQRLLHAQESKGQFKSSRKAAGTYSSPEHATRVAWRVVKDWLAAQLTIIEAQMATLDEVMLPYLIVEGERTLREQWRDHLAIGPGGDR